AVLARGVTDSSGAGALFVVPCAAAFCLRTGTESPTPFQFLPPAYARPDQVSLTIDILERRQVAYVIVIVPMSSTDPLLRYVAAHYERVEDEQGELPLFRRVSVAH